MRRAAHRQHGGVGGDELLHDTQAVQHGLCVGGRLGKEVRQQRVDERAKARTHASVGRVDAPQKRVEGGRPFTHPRADIGEQLCTDLHRHCERRLLVAGVRRRRQPERRERTHSKRLDADVLVVHGTDNADDRLELVSIRFVARTQAP